MLPEGSRASFLNLRINGEQREVVDNLSLKELITHLGLTPERIAIELNQNVVRRADWASTVLKENDRVEIVHFVGGGSAVESMQSADGSNQRRALEFPKSVCELRVYQYEIRTPQFEIPCFGLIAFGCKVLS